MKKCSIFSYYEGLDRKGIVIVSGNHCCDVEYDGAMNAGEYTANTVEYIKDDVKADYPSLHRIVLKQVTIFPGD